MTLYVKLFLNDTLGSLISNKDAPRFSSQDNLHGGMLFMGHPVPKDSFSNETKMNQILDLPMSGQGSLHTTCS